MDDKTKTEHDGKLISLTEDYEVQYWTAALGVDETTLRIAVEMVGHSAAKVRAWLAEQAGEPGP
jgi:hypothetical protein